MASFELLKLEENTSHILFGRNSCDFCGDPIEKTKELVKLDNNTGCECGYAITWIYICSDCLLKISKLFSGLKCERCEETVFKPI